MNHGVWKGIESEQSHILILGESHHEKGDQLGANVGYKTSQIIETYLTEESIIPTHMIFRKIANSFGWIYENEKAFWNRIYFGNYADTYGGIAASEFKEILKRNRKRYNDELFAFVNDNSITTIFCFSKRVWNLLPSEAYYEKHIVGKIGKQNNTVEKCRYAAQIPHRNTDVLLKQDLTVFGIRHPSGKSGYNASQIYDYFCKQPEATKILYKKRTV